MNYALCPLLIFISEKDEFNWDGLPSVESAHVLVTSFEVFSCSSLLERRTQQFRNSTAGV